MNKRFYAAYTEWEDFKKGMFSKEVRPEYIDKSTELMKDIKSAMQRVVDEWPITTKHNLSNGNSNRKSWLGQAACCINHGSSEMETRLCWRLLPKEIQQSANEAANEVINEWDIKNNFNKKLVNKNDNLFV